MKLPLTRRGMLPLAHTSLYLRTTVLSRRLRYTSAPMLAFIVRRLLLTLPVVWIVVTLVFGLIHMVPGDPVAQMLGEGASVTQVERMRHELGLDQPVLEQYRTYMTGVLHGDLGNSFRNQKSVARSILDG